MEELNHTPERIDQAVRKLSGIPEGIRRWVLRPIPWVILVIAGVIIVWAPGGFDYMLFSGILAAVLAIMAFDTLMQMTPGVFRSLWQRGVIGLKQDEQSASPSTDRAGLENLLLDFIDDLDKTLNHRIGQWAMGVFFALIGLVILVDQLGAGFRGLALLFTNPAALEVSGIWRYQIGIFGEPLIGLVIGLMAWRMLVVSIYVARLGRSFDLKTQLGHPDQCGGLEPLGNLCLWNALIITIPAIHLGLWIIIAPAMPRYERWPPMLTRLLPVPMAFAILSFTVPLLGIHRMMRDNQVNIQKQLDQLGQDIDELARKMLEDTGMPLQEREESARQLALMREFYEQNKRIPVWPINADILKRFVTSQVVPVLGLTGLGEPFIKLVKGLLDFLYPS